MLVCVTFKWKISQILIILSAGHESYSHRTILPADHVEFDTLYRMCKSSLPTFNPLDTMSSLAIVWLFSSHINHIAKTLKPWTEVNSIYVLQGRKASKHCCRPATFPYVSSTPLIDGRALMKFASGQHIELFLECHWVVHVKWHLLECQDPRPPCTPLDFKKTINPIHFTYQWF